MGVKDALAQGDGLSHRMRLTVPIRQHGRIVVPQAVRDELNLTYGDLVELDVRPAASLEKDAR